jgi:hypothetical protein
MPKVLPLNRFGREQTCTDQQPLVPAGSEPAGPVECEVVGPHEERIAGGGARDSNGQAVTVPWAESASEMASKEVAIILRQRAQIASAPLYVLQWSSRVSRDPG